MFVWQQLKKKILIANVIILEGWSVRSVIISFEGGKLHFHAPIGALVDS